MKLCKWCDTSESEITGPALEAEFVLISGPNKGDEICSECWGAHTNCSEDCKVKPA